MPACDKELQRSQPAVEYAHEVRYGLERMRLS